MKNGTNWNAIFVSCSVNIAGQLSFPSEQIYHRTSFWVAWEMCIMFASSLCPLSSIPFLIPACHHPSWPIRLSLTDMSSSLTNTVEVNGSLPTCHHSSWPIANRYISSSLTDSEITIEVNGYLPSPCHFLSIRSSRCLLHFQQLTWWRPCAAVH